MVKNRKELRYRTKALQYNSVLRTDVMYIVDA
jgi:hypothetical protein